MKISTLYSHSALLLSLALAGWATSYAQNTEPASRQAALSLPTAQQSSYQTWYDTTPLQSDTDAQVPSQIALRRFKQLSGSKWFPGVWPNDCSGNRVQHDLADPAPRS